MVGEEVGEADGDEVGVEEAVDDVEVELDDEGEVAV